MQRVTFKDSLLYNLIKKGKPQHKWKHNSAHAQWIIKLLNMRDQIIYESLFRQSCNIFTKFKNYIFTKIKNIKF